MFCKALLVLACSSAAFANVFTTAPIASTTYSGGKPAVVRWQDDGSAPAIKDFGLAQVSIYVGNAQQQTRLQTLNASVDVSLVSELDFTPDASIGPNGNEYFIRFESIALKDAAQPQFPALAFSAKFTLDSMTGVFPADVLAQIAGQSTAPLSSPTAASRPNAAAASSSPSLTATSTSQKTTPTASPSPSASNAASALSGKVGWAGAIFGALLGITMF